MEVRRAPWWWGYSKAAVGLGYTPGLAPVTELRASRLSVPKPQFLYQYNGDKHILYWVGGGVGKANEIMDIQVSCKL